MKKEYFLHSVARSEFDHLPTEVALEVLCEPKARITNRERKIFHAAREVRYISTRQPKPREVTLAAKLRHAEFSQLIKWLPRSIHRRLSIQKRYVSLQAMPETRQRNQLMIACDVSAGALEVFRDALETELETRATNTPEARSKAAWVKGF